MAHSTQPDLFRDEQPELFDADAAPVVYRADPVKVRARLQSILEEARAASSNPWDEREQQLYITIFPQMSEYLPEEEGAQLRFAFEAEMARLRVA